MSAIGRFGTMSRRTSLLAAVGAVTVLTGAAAAGPDSGTTAPATSGSGMYLLGDSWAAGLHADPKRALGQVAAQALGMRLTLDAVSGTGYVNTAGRSNYLQRARTATGSAGLVVVQGGSNDDHQALADIRTNALATWAALQSGFPSARLLALGPGPDPEPVDAVQRAVDATLHDAAHAAGVDYISMLKQRWIPEEHSDLVIDPTTDHPSVAGQAYLGFRLAAATRVLEPELFAAA